MRALVSLLVVLAGLLLPAAASAKGEATVRVCGPTECVLLEDRLLGAHVASPQETVDPPPASRFYRLEIAFETGATREAYWALFAPEEGLIATNAGGLLWYVPRTDALRALEAATRELEAYPEPSAWPRYVEAADSPARSTPTADGAGDWVPTGIAAGALLLAVAAGALLVRRARPPLSRA